MPMEVAQGGEPSDVMLARQVREHMALLRGEKTMKIWLNGGSEDRRETRAYWREWAEEAGLMVRSETGYQIEIGCRT